MAYTHFHSGDQYQNVSSDHQLVLYIESGGPGGQWNGIYAMLLSEWELQYQTFSTAQGRQGMLESNCMIGEETSNMKGCIESKCTVNTVVSERIGLLDNTY